jgi:hypothetical protein
MSLARRAVTPSATASWSSGTPYISAVNSRPAASAAVASAPDPGAVPGPVTPLFHHARRKWRRRARARPRAGPTKSDPVLVPVLAIGHNVCST